MRRNNLLSSFRRAFSLTELIIVLVILGLLAAISIVGYAAVVDRSEDVAAEATAASVEREMRALMAFDAGSGIDGTEESLNNAFQAVKADLPAGVQLSTIGGTLQNDLACGEQVVVIRDGQNSGMFTPLCDDDTATVDYTVSWLTVGDGTNSGGKITVGDDSLVVTATSPQALNVVASGYQQFNMTFDAPLDDGGSPVTGYEYRYAFDGAEPTGSWTAVSGSPVDFNAPGGTTSIEVHVRAVNAAGTSDAAEYTASIPQFFPNPVSNLSVTPVGPGLFNYSFDPAVVPNSGPAVSSYEYRMTLDGVEESTWKALPSGVSGSITATVAITDFVMKVKALNSAGESTVVSVTDLIPPFTPAAPAGLTVEAVGIGVLVDYTITEGAAIGSPTTDWEWRYAVEGGSWSNWTSTGSADLTGQVTIPGMDIGDIFEVELRGVNSYGSGLATIAAATVSDFTPRAVEFIVVGGGGGAGGCWGYYDPWPDFYQYCGGGGGGGAGGYISSVDGERSGGNTDPVADFSPVAGVVYSVSVGAGGRVDANGSASRLGDIVASGGGKGGFSGQSNRTRSGSAGGSGGGGGGGIFGYGGDTYSKDGGSGTAGQGFGGTAGAHGSCGKCGKPGGGGGGALGTGAICGGPGATSSITGSSVLYARGGGGRAEFSQCGGASYAGPANSGFGGSAWCCPGGYNASAAGGSGVVIIRIPLGQTTPTISGGLTYTTSSVDGDTVIKFTAGSGTISW